MKEKHTCILLFSRSAASESKRKQLLADDDANAQLHDVLYHRAVNTITKSGLPVLRIDEHQQVGTSFGEKFCNAISFAFNQGFENVIAVGSDCPSLRAIDIQYAHNELQAGRSCLGPSIDGGVYLLAISKEFFNSSFRLLPWKTSILSEKLSDLLLGLNAQLTFLSSKLDIDNKTQLNTIACFLKKQLGIHISLLSSLAQTEISPVLPLKDRLYELGLSLRGPPSFQLAA